MRGRCLAESTVEGGEGHPLVDSIGPCERRRQLHRVVPAQVLIPGKPFSVDRDLLAQVQLKKVLLIGTEHSEQRMDLFPAGSAPSDRFGKRRRNLHSTDDGHRNNLRLCKSDSRFLGPGLAEVSLDQRTGVEVKEHTLSTIFKEHLRHDLVSFHLNSRSSGRGFLSAPLGETRILEGLHFFPKRLLLLYPFFSGRTETNDGLTVAGDCDGSTGLCLLQEGLQAVLQLQDVRFRR